MCQIFMIYLNLTYLTVTTYNTSLGRCSLPHQHTENYSADLIPAWIINYIHYYVWDEITYQLLNFNGATVEV